MEPTYADIVAQYPSATINPATQQAVHPNRVYKVLREDCYDQNPEFPWRNQHRVSKKALTADAMGRRLQWAKSMLPTEHSHNWYYQNLVWTYICNSVLARSAKKADEQTLVRKGGRGWISDDSKYEPENMRADTNLLKLAGSDTERVYWAPAQRLKAIVRDINAKYDIDSLCCKFPERLQLIVDGKGKKLRT